MNMAATITLNLNSLAQKCSLLTFSDKIQFHFSLSLFETVKKQTKKLFNYLYNFV